jgi:3-oxoacyl-[acyl-carrier-protein] synthase-3
MDQQTPPLPEARLAPAVATARRTVIAGTGSYLPTLVVTNDELSKSVDTSDAWIRERTGIGQRHLAQPHETCAYMATKAAERALAAAGMQAREIDAILLATATPDEAFPATALRVQAALGAGGFGFDLSAACSGFIYALGTADAMIAAGRIRTALVIGSEVYSRIMNWQDRGTCVLFGDGAGAVVLRASDVPPGEAGGGEAGAGLPGILSIHLHGDGQLGDILYVDGAVGRPDKPGHLVMNGREVFRQAVTRLSETVEEALAANGLTKADLGWLVPHQANKRIIDAIGKRLGLPPERVVTTVERHANTSAASVPLALDEAVRDGRIRPGDLVLMEALGGGLTWGSALVRM